MRGEVVSWLSGGDGRPCIQYTFLLVCIAFNVDFSVVQISELEYVD